MSAVVEEPEATAAKETKAASAAVNQAEVLAAKVAVSTVGKDPETAAMSGAKETEVISVLRGRVGGGHDDQGGGAHSGGSASA